MNTQVNKRWQSLLLITIAVVLLLGASFPAVAQDASYKVGDRVEVQSAGKWFKAEIIEVRAAGEYVIRFDTGESGSSTARYLRPIKADAPTNNQDNAGNQVQNQTKGNNRADNQTAGQKPAQTAKTNRFGARDPRTCDNTKAPARGAITAALALKYLNCQMEKVSGGHLYLVENVKVEVGGGIPYRAIMGHRSLSEIDVNHPVYPIRGSLLRYQCLDPVSEHVGPPNTNCNTYNEPKATGYCYKTTFGDWRCYMSDTSNIKENFRTNVAPPK